MGPLIIMKVCIDYNCLYIHKQSLLKKPHLLKKLDRDFNLYIWRKMRNRLLLRK